MNLLLMLATVMSLMLGLPGAAANARGNEAATAAAALRNASDRPADKQADRAFLVGVWETRNTEQGRDVQVIWTARRDGSLDYDFVIDGVASRGSTGIWEVRDGVLVETWQREDGSTASGRAAIEKIDDNTFKLTVIDNGHPEYQGVVRIYRRVGPPQTVESDGPARKPSRKSRPAA